MPLSEKHVLEPRALCVFLRKSTLCEFRSPQQTRSDFCRFAQHVHHHNASTCAREDAPPQRHEPCDTWFFHKPWRTRRKDAITPLIAHDLEQCIFRASCIARLKPCRINRFTCEHRGADLVKQSLMKLNQRTRLPIPKIVVASDRFKECLRQRTTGEREDARECRRTAAMHPKYEDEVSACDGVRELPQRFLPLSVRASRAVVARHLLTARMVPRADILELPSRVRTERTHVVGEVIEVLTRV